MPQKLTSKRPIQQIKELETKIADLEQDNDNLLREENEFKALMDDLDDFVFMTDIDGNVTYHNKAIETVLKISPNGNVGKSFLHMLSKESLETASENFHMLLQGEKREYDLTLTNRKTYHLKSKPLKDDRGNIIGTSGIATDVTEHRRTQEELQESSENYRLLVETMNDGIGMSDKDFKVTYVNPRLAEMLGYLPDEMLGSHVTEFFANDKDLKIVQGNLFQNGDDSPKSYEIYLKKKDGSLICTHVSPMPLFNHKGGFKGGFVVIADITKRKQDEAALRESEEKFKTIFNNANDEILYLDINGVIIDVNKKMTDIFGYTRNEIIGTNITDIEAFTPEALGKNMKLFNDIINGEPPRMIEYEIVRKDGLKVFVETNSTVIKKSEKPVGIITIIRDITERRKMEQALRESEELYSNVFESISDGILVLDTDFYYTYWNKGMEEVSRVSRDDVINSGDHAWEIFPDLFDDNTREMLNKAMQGDVVEREAQYTLKNGKAAFSLEMYHPLRSTTGEIRGIVGVIRDITRPKNTEAALKKAKEDAEAATIAKSEFLANMSHEIRTPMNGVIGMTNLIIGTRLNKEQREYAQTIKKSADSLLDVINDILDFSKIEAGQLSLEQIDFDLRKTMEGITDLLAIRAYTKGLKFACLMDNEVPSFVEGDPGRLKQILINLAGNAIKFTEVGEVIVRVTASKETEKNVTLSFAVSDTGIGIQEDMIEGLFESFSQVDASMSRKYGGTGLGLAISKQLSELMGGSIGVESKVGEGSVFRFEVVLKKQENVTEPLFEDLRAEEIKEENILVVDDNEINRLVLKEQLKSWECRFDEAIDGRQALDKLRKAVEAGDPFSVALIDMQMPDMGGQALGQKIKSDPLLKNVTMVMLTSIGQRGDAAMMKEIGYADFLTKPIKPSKLFDCLTTVLCKKQGQQSYSTPSADKRNTVNIKLGKGRHILLAEDNLVNRKFAKRLLEKMGFKVDAVKSGVEAVEVLENIEFDLILMDVQMPDMDGFEATQVIRNPNSKVTNHKIPIIALTAHAMSGDREKCLEAGMDDYISKPINLEKLVEVINRQLDG